MAGLREREAPTGEYRLREHLRSKTELPFNGTAVFNSTYTTKDQLKSNIINLVLTEPGERINEPSFGVGIKRYIFEETIDQGALLDNITYQTQIFIPELEIIDLLIKPVPDENTATPLPNFRKLSDLFP